MASSVWTESASNACSERVIVQNLHPISIDVDAHILWNRTNLPKNLGNQKAYIGIRIQISSLSGDPKTLRLPVGKLRRNIMFSCHKWALLLLAPWQMATKYPKIMIISLDTTSHHITINSRWGTLTGKICTWFIFMISQTWNLRSHPSTEYEMNRKIYSWQVFTALQEACGRELCLSS